jgi:hypothetical protein
VFNGLEVVFTDGESIQFSLGKLEGNSLFCPNTPTGHLVRGDREFDGAVDATASITLRVAADGSALLADVTYHVIESH